MSHAEQPSFHAYKHQEDCGRDEDIQTEESADPVGEELTHEQTEVQPVFHDPWDELRVGDGGAKKAKKQVNIFAIHRVRSSWTSIEQIIEAFLRCSQALRASSCAGQIGL